MKRLLLVSLFLVSAASFAQSFSFNSGVYYGQQGNVSNVCSYAHFNNFGQCVQSCKVAQWRSIYGTQWGYVQIYNGFGYNWQYRQVTRNWWHYSWSIRVIRSNGCFY